MKCNCIRIDPAEQGFHLVDVVNGCERIFVPFNEVDNLIDDIMEVKK